MLTSNVGRDSIHDVDQIQMSPNIYNVDIDVHL